MAGGNSRMEGGQSPGGGHEWAIQSTPAWSGTRKQKARISKDPGFLVKTVPPKAFRPRVRWNHLLGGFVEYIAEVHQIATILH